MIGSHECHLNEQLQLYLQGGSVQICRDYKRTANEATRLEYYPIRQLEHLCTKLVGGISFTKWNMSPCVSTTSAGTEIASSWSQSTPTKACTGTIAHLWEFNQSV